MPTSSTACPPYTRSTPTSPSTRTRFCQRWSEMNRHEDRDCAANWSRSSTRWLWAAEAAPSSWQNSTTSPLSYLDNKTAKDSPRLREKSQNSTFVDVVVWHFWRFHVFMKWLLELWMSRTKRTNQWRDSVLCDFVSRKKNLLFTFFVNYQTAHSSLTHHSFYCKICTVYRNKGQRCYKLNSF